MAGSSKRRSTGGASSPTRTATVSGSSAATAATIRAALDGEGAIFDAQVRAPHDWRPCLAPQPQRPRPYAPRSTARLRSSTSSCGRGSTGLLDSPDTIRANALAAAAVRPRDHFETMTVGVRKIDAASVVIAIDLPRSPACRVGPIVQALRLDPLQHCVELRFGDQKRRSE